MCPPPASGKGGRPMTRTREISGSGQIFALLVLSQCFWLLCCRPSLVNGLLSMAASAVAYGVVFLLAVFCRRCAARGETPLSPVFAAWGAFLAVGYFAVTAEQLLSAARVLFEGVFSPLLLLLVLLGAVWAAAAAGQEALGRAAFVSLFLFLIAVLLLTLGVLPQATALNLRLPEEELSRLGEEILSILPTMQPAAVCRPAAVGARRLVAGRPFAAIGGAGAGALRQPAALPHDAAGPVGRAFRHGAGLLLFAYHGGVFPAYRIGGRRRAVGRYGWLPPKMLPLGRRGAFPWRGSAAALYRLAGCCRLSHLGCDGPALADFCPAAAAGHRE